MAVLKPVGKECLLQHCCTWEARQAQRQHILECASLEGASLLWEQGGKKLMAWGKGRDWEDVPVRRYCELDELG